MADKTLTTANSVILLTIPGLYVPSVTLQGYDVDDVFSTDAVDTAETRMGVDGRLSAGWVPAAVPVEYALQADSASIQVFEDWDAAEQAAKEKIFAQGLVRIPGIGKSFVKTRGVLQRLQRMPSAGKVLRARRFTVVWESVAPASI